MKLVRTLESLSEDGSGLLDRVARMNRDDLASMVDALISIIAEDGQPMGRIRVPLPMVQVAEVGGMWTVILVGRGEPEIVQRSSAKLEAVERGRREASERRGSLLVHRADGSLMETYHYG